MADEIERFQSHQAMLEADRIQRIRQQLTGISALFCDDCGAPVPAERRRLIPGVRKCVGCRGAGDSGPPLQEVAVKWMWYGLLISLPLAAKDLGVQGDLWPVQEQSMLSLIHQRLESMEASGQLAEMQTQFKERVVQNTLRPKPVEGLQTDTRSHTHRVDPTVSVTADMADQNGRILPVKGSVLTRWIPCH